MADDFLHELYTRETLKLPAVLMGVASAAIGFAFHETADRQLSWSLSLTLLAVLLWGVSFASGALYSQKITSAIKANIGINEAERIGYAEGKALSQSRFKEFGNSAIRYYRAQQWSLLAGALAYLAGHIWHIAGSAY